MTIQTENKILYLRSGPYVLNYNSYNLQEVGLGKAFCKAGFDVDIVYYEKENHDQKIFTKTNNLNILWRKGFKVFRTGIYPFALNKEFLAKYHIVIVSEYSQLMTVLISALHPNVYLYNGPYYNLFKVPFMEKIYDRLFCNYINRKVQKVFSKSNMAKEYIAEKGITNSVVTGVGLDSEKFSAEIKLLPDTENLLKKMEGYRNLLYVGNIIPRKNVFLIIESFIRLKKLINYEDVQLVLVGKEDANYGDKCRKLIPDEIKKSVIFCPFIENAQLQFVYQKADIFLLPSKKEIFGMVLLEAMFFGVPVISSYSAGGDTLIKNGENGIIIHEFEADEWLKQIKMLLDNVEIRKKLSIYAKRTINQEFMWDNIVEKMLKYMS